MSPLATARRSDTRPVRPARTYGRWVIPVAGDDRYRVHAAVSAAIWRAANNGRLSGCHVALAKDAPQVVAWTGSWRDRRQVGLVLALIRQAGIRCPLAYLGSDTDPFAVVYTAGAGSTILRGRSGRTVVNAAPRPAAPVTRASWPSAAPYRPGRPAGARRGSAA